MRVLGVGRSDVGRKRANNEDSLFVDNDRSFFIISDGMGGHAAGEVASRTAVEAVVQALEERYRTIEEVRTGRKSEDELIPLVDYAVQCACLEVHRLATSTPELAGMGCTLTLLVTGQNRLAMGHVGDTRLYLHRNGKVHQMSSDHTLAGELVRAGTLLPEAAHGHQFAHVLTRAIGAQAGVRVDSTLVDAFPDDRFLLCSDGLGNYVKDLSALEQMLAGGDDLDRVADALVDFANESGGEDNVSVVVLRVDADDAEGPVALAIREDAQIKLTALSSLFLFEGLPLEQTSHVLAVCEVTSHEAGVSVLSAGDELDHLSVVLAGVYSLSTETETAELRAGEFFGETTLTRPRPARATVVASEPSRLLTLGSSGLAGLMEKRPWLAGRVLQRLAHRLSLELERERSGLQEGRSASVLL